MNVFAKKERSCQFDLSVCVTWSGLKKKKVWKALKPSKMILAASTNLKVITWAVQFVVRLVEAW
jgi:hypothetical protein